MSETHLSRVRADELQAGMLIDLGGRWLTVAEVEDEGGRDDRYVTVRTKRGAAHRFRASDVFEVERQVIV